MKPTQSICLVGVAIGCKAARQLSNIGAQQKAEQLGFGRKREEMVSRGVGRGKTNKSTLLTTGV